MGSEATFSRSIGIQGVWFNWYCIQQRAKSLPIPATLRDVPKADVKAAKVQIAELVQTRFQNMPISIRRTTYTSKKGTGIERLGALTDAGNLLGLLTLDGEGHVAKGQWITLEFVLTVDGNIRAVWSLATNT